MAIPLAIPAIIGLASQVIGMFDGDKKEQGKLLLNQLETESRLLLAQIEVNKTEAAHRSIFVAGWRPFIGWVGGLGIFYEVLARPLILIFAPSFFPHLTNDTLPSVEPVLWELVFSMLGLGGLRSFEKLRRVSK